MSRKTIIITISVILIIFLLSLIGYYFIIQNNTGDTSTSGSVFKNFFPFGGNDNVENAPATTTRNEPQQNKPSENFTVKLRELSSEPVSGAGTLDLKAGTVVRYIEKATGHVFEVELFSPNKNRISNTTIPLVYDALWGNKNNSLVARYLDDDNQTVDTYGITVKGTGTSTEQSVLGVAFPQRIGDVSVFGTNVFYLVLSDDSSSGFVSNFDGTKKKQIWSSPLRELNSQFVNTKTVALNTKPYPDISGYLYLVDTTTGNTRRILGDIPGLSSLVSPDGSQVIYLSQSETVRFILWNSKAKTSIEATPATFPEKCVWSSKDSSTVYCAVPKNYIGSDSQTRWYQGLELEDDDIWKYNLKDNTSSIIENLASDAGESIDVIKPILSENEQYLIFMNKVDNSLWSLDLTK